MSSIPGNMRAEMEAPLLDVQKLRVEFFLRRGTLTAVDDVSFSLREKESLGIVGETGCGKSMTALSILGLVPCPPGKISGQVIFEGEDLIQKNERELGKIRGRKIAIIFQEPLTALNPAFTVGEQVSECYRVHLGHSRRAARESAEDILNSVRVPSPRLMMKLYPHELSGGLRQRVMIGIALACQPKLLIADEPTTALDVTVQAQILELLEELREKMNLAIIFISHNLGVVARLCDRIAVMYAGALVELPKWSQGVSTRCIRIPKACWTQCRDRNNGMNISKRFPVAFAILFTLRRAANFIPAVSKPRKSAGARYPNWRVKAPGHAVACFFPGES